MPADQRLALAGDRPRGSAGRLPGHERTGVVKGLTIRPALRRELPAVVGLVRQLAAFEKLPGPSPSAVRRLGRHAFGPKRRVRILVVRLDGNLVGYVFTFFAYSTFLARPTLFIEDIYVVPEARSRGGGEAVMGHLGRLAAEEGCGRIFP